MHLFSCLYRLTVINTLFSVRFTNQNNLSSKQFIFVINYVFEEFLSFKKSEFKPMSVIPA